MKFCLVPPVGTSKKGVIDACSRLINGVGSPSELQGQDREVLGTIYSVRAMQGFDNASRCGDAQKAMELTQDPNVQTRMRNLVEEVCSADRASIPAQSNAACGEQLEQYVARLGQADHFNSRGVRLLSVAAILRQDRANFHEFGVRDDGDENDSYFANKENRARMEYLLNAGTISGNAGDIILNMTPKIRVTVCAQPDAIFVEVAN